VRYVDGDLLSFVHKGSGLLETEFGPLRYRQGDWVYIPKACTWRQVPDEESTLLMIQATDEFRVPPPGYMGRHFPFDPSQATIPEPAPIDDDGRDEYEVQLVHSPIDGVGTTSLLYQHHPLDVEGWRGDNFAFTFNIDDYNVVTSNSVHLPPTVHLFMEATGVYVMNFLPKPPRACLAPNAHPGITATSTTTRLRSSTAGRYTASRCRRASFRMRHKAFTTVRPKRRESGRGASSMSTTRSTGR